MKHAAWRYTWRRRLRKGAAAAAVMFGAMLLQGCWDEVNLDDISYISALGIDYQDGQYHIYSQMIKFGIIAKTDAVQPDPNPVWIGQGKGETLLLALGDLTTAGQAVLSLEHLKTVIVHERAFGQMDHILDGVNRQRASRYTSLLFGTRAPIEKIFTTDTFFDQSPLNSIMYAPGPNTSQRSFIRPYQMQLVVQTLKEPAMTTTLPALTANEDYWKRKKQPLQIQYIDGIFVFSGLQFVGYLPEEEASGLRWVNPEFKQYLIGAEGKDGRTTVAVHSSQSKVHASFNEGRPAFELKVRLSGDVAEMNGSMKKEEIVAIIEAKVKQQIEDTYRKGLSKKMDLFQLEHNLYRYHNGEWREIVKANGWLPEADQLKIEVDFQLIHTGKFDLNENT